MEAYVARLKKKYKDQVVPAMMKQFSYTSVMQVPKVSKIAINQGVGKATSDKKMIDVAVTEMTTITGQKAMATKSKKDISNFKLRVGVGVGVCRPVWFAIRDRTRHPRS